MGSVSQIDDYRKHLTINLNCVGRNEIIVLPLSVIQDYVKGKLKFADIDNFEDIIKCILQDWLNEIE